MKWFSLSTKTISTALLAGFFSQGTLASSNEAHEARGLFSANTVTAQKALPMKGLAKRAKVGKSRSVEINRKKLRKGRFVVDLPGDISFEVVRELQHEMGQERFAWVGHAGSNLKNRAVFGVSGNAVAGTFSYEGKLFKLEPRANGEHIVSEVNPRDPAPELDPIPVFDMTAFAADAVAAAEATTYAAASDSAGSVIDILVAYTPAVQALYGTSGIEALIIQAMAETNQAYANSGMATRLNLVETVLTPYTTSGNMLTDLGRLRSKNDGYMDELHSLRDTHGADLVNLIDNQAGYCGLAYRMTRMSSSFASSAFSVVNHSCATGYYSFGHELGHNQGLHHDPAAAAGSTSVFPYAYGFQEAFGEFRTVMAYNCPGGCARVNHFSNPGIMLNGTPTGIPDYTDNARALENTAATVANFRAATLQTPPSEPSGIEAVSVSSDSVQLNWADNSNDESGFYLERAVLGSNFSQVASLPANTTYYMDSELQSETNYIYRARAWNSSGISEYSATVAIWTELGPYIDQAPIFGLGTSAPLSGQWSDTAASDGTVFSIGERPPQDYWFPGFSGFDYFWLINVEAGETVTLYADAQTDSLSQAFKFSYQQFDGPHGISESGWINMFSVTPWWPVKQEFRMPDGLSGLILVRVNDNVRVQGQITTDSLDIDSLYVRTELGSDQ